MPGMRCATAVSTRSYDPESHVTFNGATFLYLYLKLKI